jgi:hypothetical protein
MENIGAAFQPEDMFGFPDPYPLFAELRRSQPVLLVQFDT